MRIEILIHRHTCPNGENVRKKAHGKRQPARSGRVRTAALLLAAVMAFSVTGCAKSEAEMAADGLGMEKVFTALTPTPTVTPAPTATPTPTLTPPPTEEPAVSEPEAAESADSTAPEESSAEASVGEPASAPESAPAEESTAAEEPAAEESTSAETGENAAQDADSAQAQWLATSTYNGTVSSDNVDYAYLYTLDNTHMTTGYDKNSRDERNRPYTAVILQDTFGSSQCEALHGEGQTVHLTFNIGNYSDSINTVLDILAEKNVKATFFVVIGQVYTYPDLIRRIIDEGHTLGSHSMTHPSGGVDTLSVEELVQDCMNAQSYIQTNYGYDMKYYAFPSGYFSPRAVATVEQLGYYVVFNRYASYDYEETVAIDPTEHLNDMLWQLHPGAIYELHAFHQVYPQMLGAFIDEARARGYTFENFN